MASNENHNSRFLETAETAKKIFFSEWKVAVLKSDEGFWQRVSRSEQETAGIYIREKGYLSEHGTVFQQNEI